MVQMESNIESKTIKLTFVGDVLCDKNMSDELENYRSLKDGTFDFNSVFVHMKGMFDHSDYVLANLETPISKDHSSLTCEQWEFCSAFEFAEALHNAGVDYVSTANNHCLDRGIEGILSTIQCLNEINLAHSGTTKPREIRKPLIVDVDGLKIGLLSYTYGTNAVSNHQYLNFKYRHVVDLLQEQEGSLERIDPLKWYIRHRPGGRIEALSNKIDAILWPKNVGKEWFEKTTWGGYRRFLLKRDLRWLKRHGADLTAIYLHIGGQYNQEPNKYTKQMVKWLLSKGANIVIGNHEHVVLESLNYLEKNQMATYAIGNFLGSAGTLHPPYDRRADYSIAVHVYIDKYTKRLSKIAFSVLKVVYTSVRKYEVWPVYDLLNQLPEEEKRMIEKDSLLVASVFSGIQQTILREEFSLSESVED